MTIQNLTDEQRAFAEALRDFAQRECGTREQRDALTNGGAEPHNRELYKRIAAMAVHAQAMGRGLETAVGRYNQFVGSLETQVHTQARRFEDLKVDHEGKEIPELAPIETAVRPLAKLAPVLTLVEPAPTSAP